MSAGGRGRHGGDVSSCRDIQRISGCRIDVDRVDSASFERKIVMRGTSKQLSVAKELIQEKVAEEEQMRGGVTSRQPRLGRHNQPLFLSYQEEEAVDSAAPAQPQEQLHAAASDNCIEVFVSGVESPGQFWVQKVGPHSVELDKLTQNMTDFYAEDSNRKLMAVATVQVLYRCHILISINFFVLCNSEDWGHCGS